MSVAPAVKARADGDRELGGYLEPERRGMPSYRQIACALPVGIS